MRPLEPMERRTTVKKRFVARALAVAMYPSSRRIRTAGEGHHIGIPAALLRELIEEVEAEWPGLLERAKARDESIRGRELRTSGIR